MSGGGARCAYQAGFLRALHRRRPDIAPTILTGVSAGGINAAYLANRVGPFEERVEGLAGLWSRIRAEDVFETGFGSLLPLAARWALRLVTSRAGKALHVRGMVDTDPLGAFLARELEADGDGRLAGIEQNLADGSLDAVALTAAGYATGQSLTWVQGRAIQDWSRAHRKSKRCQLAVEHVMASAALPLLFPAIAVEGQWYGDGGIRLTAPLSPAVHLGASKILALSIRRERTEKQADLPVVTGYPPPAQVIGNLLNAIFLDQFDADALRLQRINELLRRLPAAERAPYRPIDLFVHRPSVDLGELANSFEARLPGALRFLTRGLGTKETRSNDLLSLLMFQPDYVQALIDLGEKDAAAQAEAIDAFLDGREEGEAG